MPAIHNLASDYVLEGVNALFVTKSNQMYSKAFPLFKQAAEKGYPPSQFSLGTYHETGLARIVPIDYNVAYCWYSASGAQGFKNAAVRRNAIKHLISSTEAKQQMRQELQETIAAMGDVRTIMADASEKYNTVLKRRAANSASVNTASTEDVFYDEYRRKYNDEAQRVKEAMNHYDIQYRYNIKKENLDSAILRTDITDKPYLLKIEKNEIKHHQEIMKMHRSNYPNIPESELETISVDDYLRNYCGYQ